MLIRKINGSTHEIGKDQGYLSLPIRQTWGDSIIGGKTVWVEKTETAWEPTPSELEALNQGASIVVQQLLFGNPFPPIYLYTESTSEDLNPLDRMKQDLGDSLDRALEHCYPRRGTAFFDIERAYDRVIDKIHELQEVLEAL